MHCRNVHTEEVPGNKLNNRLNPKPAFKLYHVKPQLQSESHVNTQKVDLIFREMWLKYRHLLFYVTITRLLLLLHKNQVIDSV